MSEKSIKIVTNSGNPVTLKPLIAASLLGFKVSLESVNVSADTKQRPRLPVLVLSSTEEKGKLFDTNAMVSYLVELGTGTGPSPALRSLFNFEENVLSPVIVAYLLDPKGETVGKELTAALTELEKRIKGQKFFSGKNKPEIEDAVVWSSVYPLFAEKDKVSANFGGLVSWYAAVEESGLSKAAVSLLQPLSGKEGGKQIMICNPSFSVGAAASKIDKLKLEDADAGEPKATISPEELEDAMAAWSKPSFEAGLQRRKAGEKILPVSGEKNYFITAALPYVNNVPHLGNIVGCVLSADVYARYCRLRGRNTLYICGTDEYGTATETKAIEEKLTPQQICDKYHKLHKEIYDWFDISFDYFGRTTTSAQTEVGQEIFLKLWNNGYLKEMVVQQLFCNPCKRFLSDRFVEGTCPSCGYEDARGDQCDKCGRLTNSTELKNPRCKVCSSTDVTTKNSDQIFLDLPKLEEKVGLEEWLNKSSEEWTSNARNIAKSWIREGLKERCITRDLKWGTPVPLEQYKDKVFYVWFDAPIGYISMTKCYTPDWKSWWVNPDPHVDIEYYQFMAKDNVPFHSILFPASLKGTNDRWTLVSHLISTEYLNYEDGKFSKSRGVGVFGNDALQTGIPADIWRFYLMFLRPESQDSAFSWDDFMLKNNSELLNNLGNFINRSLSFLVKFFDSKIPPTKLSNEDFHIVAEINKEVGEYTSLLDKCRLREALRKILAVSKIGNGYFQSQQPWTLNKNEADRERCGTICGLGAQIAFLLMSLLEPFMPGVSRQLREQLNVSEPIYSSRLLPFLKEGHRIGTVVPLFQKLEKDVIDGLRKKYAGQQQPIQESSPSKKAAVQNKPAGDASAANGVIASPQEIAALEEAILKQGNVVRDLKAAKAEKSALQPEIEKLLKLKSELSLKPGVAPTAPATSGKSKGKPGKKK